VESCSYGEFSLGLHQRLVGRRVPLDGTVELTYRCPLECSFCYNRVPAKDAAARPPELSFEEHCRILDEIASAGCLWLLYTGGEVFAREDFLDIYTYSQKKGLLVTIFTNGTLITPQTADHLAKLVPFSIEVTLYGITRKTYERITGVPGSFESCLRGIQLLKERNLPLKIKTMAVSSNRHEIWEMKRFVQQDLGLEFRFDGMINPGIDRSQRPLNFRLSPEQIVELDVLDPARIQAWEDFVRQFNGPVHKTAGCDEMYHCGGGINSFSINPHGKLSLCLFSQADTYDLRKGTFRDGWDNFLLNVRRRKMRKMTKCVQCEIKSMCGMCPASGELEQGDPESPVDFLCQLAHLRSYALDFPVAPHGECEYCRGGGRYDDMKSSAAFLKSKARRSADNNTDVTGIRAVCGVSQNR
jgi:radical SAM protein with 4Fe4S-binding SPASM domain